MQLMKDFNQGHTYIATCIVHNFEPQTTLTMKRKARGGHSKRPRGKFVPQPKQVEKEKPLLLTKNSKTGLYLVKFPKQFTSFLRVENRKARLGDNPLTLGTLTLDPEKGDGFLQFTEAVKEATGNLSGYRMDGKLRQHPERVFFLDYDMTEVNDQGYIKTMLRGQRDKDAVLPEPSTSAEQTASVRYVDSLTGTAPRNVTMVRPEEIPSGKHKKEDKIYQRSHERRKTLSEEEIMDKLLGYFEKNTDGFTKHQLEEMQGQSWAKIQPVLNQIAEYDREKKLWVLKMGKLSSKRT